MQPLLMTLAAASRSPDFMETILNALSYILPVVLALGIPVFVHELGHFLTAKLFKMRVEQFSIGFPPKVIKPEKENQATDSFLRKDKVEDNQTVTC